MGGGFQEGIDVSQANGKVDWPALKKSGIAFGYARATEGLGDLDERFPTHYAAMRAAGIPRGASHRLHPQYDARQQALQFIRRLMPPKPGDLPPAVVVDSDGRQNAAAIVGALQTWLDVVETALKRTPVVCTAPFFWNDFLAGTTAFARYPLWVVEATSRGQPRLPSGFVDHTMWRRDCGTLAGVDGAAGRNRFNGPLDALRRFAGY